MKEPLRQKNPGFRLVFLTPAWILLACVALFGSRTPASHFSPSLGEPASGEPPDAGGTVRGTVYLVTPDRKPLTADVDLRRVSDSKYLFSQESDSDGQFVFPPVPPGEYDVWVFLTADGPEALGCSDVVMLDKRNLFGARYGGSDVPFSMPDLSLRHFIDVDRVMRSSGKNNNPLKAYYASSPSIVVQEGQTEDLEIGMLCQ